MLKMRIGGYDKRKLMFKGVIELENFEYAGHSGTFCVMHRDQVTSIFLATFMKLQTDAKYLCVCVFFAQGNPISWRQLWKSIIVSPSVEPHVLRKR